MTQEQRSLDADAPRRARATGDDTTAPVIFHVALSVDIDRFTDRQIRQRYLSSFVAAGAATTVEAVRELCRESRDAGLAVFPPCDHTDTRGCCLGHAGQP